MSSHLDFERRVFLLLDDLLTKNSELIPTGISQLRQSVALVSLRWLWSVRLHNFDMPKFRSSLEAFRVKPDLLNVSTVVLNLLEASNSNRTHDCSKRDAVTALSFTFTPDCQHGCITGVFICDACWSLGSSWLLNPNWRSIHQLMNRLDDYIKSRYNDVLNHSVPPAALEYAFSMIVIEELASGFSSQYSPEAVLVRLVGDRYSMSSAAVQLALFAIGEASPLGSTSSKAAAVSSQSSTGLEYIELFDPSASVSSASSSSSSTLHRSHMSSGKEELRTGFTAVTDDVEFTSEAGKSESSRGPAAASDVGLSTPRTQGKGKKTSPSCKSGEVVTTASAPESPRLVVFDLNNPHVPIKHLSNVSPKSLVANNLAPGTSQDPEMLSKMKQRQASVAKTEVLHPKQLQVSLDKLAQQFKNFQALHDRDIGGLRAELNEIRSHHAIADTTLVLHSLICRILFRAMKLDMPDVIINNGLSLLAGHNGGHYAAWLLLPSVKSGFTQPLKSEFDKLLTLSSQLRLPFAHPDTVPSAVSNSSAHIAAPNKQGRHNRSLFKIGDVFQMVETALQDDNLIAHPEAQRGQFLDLLIGAEEAVLQHCEHKQSRAVCNVVAADASSIAKCRAILNRTKIRFGRTDDADKNEAKVENLQSPRQLENDSRQQPDSQSQVWSQHQRGGQGKLQQQREQQQPQVGSQHQSGGQGKHPQKPQAQNKLQSSVTN